MVQYQYSQRLRYKYKYIRPETQDLNKYLNIAQGSSVQWQYINNKNLNCKI